MSARRRVCCLSGHCKTHAVGLQPRGPWLRLATTRPSDQGCDSPLQRRASLAQGQPLVGDTHRPQRVGRAAWRCVRLLRLLRLLPRVVVVMVVVVVVVVSLAARWPRRPPLQPALAHRCKWTGWAPGCGGCPANRVKPTRPTAARCRTWCLANRPARPTRPTRLTKPAGGRWAVAPHRPLAAGWPARCSSGWVAGPAMSSAPGPGRSWCWAWRAFCCPPTPPPRNTAQHRQLAGPPLRHWSHAAVADAMDQQCARCVDRLA